VGRPCSCFVYLCSFPLHCSRGGICLAARRTSGTSGSLLRWGEYRREKRHWLCSESSPSRWSTRTCYRSFTLPQLCSRHSHFGKFDGLSTTAFPISFPAFSIILAFAAFPGALVFVMPEPPPTPPLRPITSYPPNPNPLHQTHESQQHPTQHNEKKTSFDLRSDT
jgi:hypothetical protein